jgi:hypothetical protein
VGCPIRTSRDHSFSAAPPGFSQLGTSFIASDNLTIRQTPLLYLIKCHACVFRDYRVVKDGAARSRAQRNRDAGTDGAHWELVEVRRFELLTSCLQSTRSTN